MCARGCSLLLEKTAAEEENKKLMEHKDAESCNFRRCKKALTAFSRRPPRAIDQERKNKKKH
jgi:hypothetical protein